MSRILRSPRRKAVLRAAIAALGAALGAVALGALHGGAATPATQGVTVPNQVGNTVSVTWAGTIPAASPHPTSDCNGAGVGNDDEALTVTIPRKGYDKFDATFTFAITWTPSNTDGQTTPAMYWPDEIRASAEPRRRSNQRLT